MFKILVVEDDRELNKTVCAYLRQNGYEAVGCLGANEAYDAMYGGTLFDLILSDIMMPGVDGFDTRMNVGVVSLMRQCTGYAIHRSHESERWFGPVLAKGFFDRS